MASNINTENIYITSRTKLKANPNCHFFFISYKICQNLAKVRYLKIRRHPKLSAGSMDVSIDTLLYMPVCYYDNHDVSMHILLLKFYPVVI